MKRVRSKCMILNYGTLAIPESRIINHFKKYPDGLIYSSDSYFVVLYNENRFDIKTDNYIKKYFGIGYFIPKVDMHSKDQALDIIERKVPDTKYIWSSGVFLQSYKEYKLFVESNIYKIELEKEKKENEKLRRKLKEKSTVKININNYMIPDIYKEINMNPFGKEDFSLYSLDDLLSLVDNKKYALTEKNYEEIFMKLIELIHYDKRYPQNHNIHITSKRDQTPKCIIYEETGWAVGVELNKVIKRLCSINLEFMKQVYNKFSTQYDDIDDDAALLLRFVYEKLNERDLPMDKAIETTLYNLTKSKAKYNEIEEL